MWNESFAPAKVNLFLHVGPVGSDGYHPLASLVTFADIGDIVRMRPANRMAFSIEGPLADELSADPNNLVTRARDLFLAELGSPGGGVELKLEKWLPIASGLGGGSSDAAATLRLMAQQLAPEWLWNDEAGTLVEIARRLGSDVPMCLCGAPRLATGHGDELSYPPVFADLDAVLVNPMRPSPTGAVYRAYDDAGASGDASPPEWPEAMQSAQNVARFLAGCRNDLEAPAIGLQPAIGKVLEALRARPETLFARMSGSGATCFALCADARDRRDLAFALEAAHPDWWVTGCTLQGFAP
jgi:4-diphosphocytidyl-2-C-methyl-D-erythritol kinase